MSPNKKMIKIKKNEELEKPADYCSLGRQIKK